MYRRTQRALAVGVSAIYHIRRTVKETGEDFHDESEIIYVNASIQDETPLGWLMHDFICQDYKDMHYEFLRNEVRYFKNTEGGKKKMCEIMENIKNRRIIEGKIDILKQIIKQQIGTLTPKIQIQLEQCSSKQLDQLTAGILYVKTEEDIITALTC